MYWERGDERRIYFGARHWLYALDARTGEPRHRLRPARAASTCGEGSAAATRGRSASA